MHRAHSLIAESRPTYSLFFSSAGRYAPSTFGSGVDVTSGGWAQLGRLRTGDIVLSLGGKSVGNVDDLESLILAAGKVKPESLVFFVKRGIQTFYAEVRPDWSSRD